MSKIKRFVQEHTKEVVVFSIFVAAVSIFFIGNAFAALTPTKSCYYYIKKIQVMKIRNLDLGK